MGLIDFFNDIDGKREVAHGSDGRVNVSSRSDGRGYYNSRDRSEAYSAAFFDTRATTNDHIFYIKNDKTDGKHLVIRSVGISNENAGAIFRLITCTGTVTGGAVLTPVNLNQAGVARSATATCRAPTDSNASPLANLVEADLVDTLSISDAYGHEEFHFDDMLRLGEGQAIAVEADLVGTDADVLGSCFFYFE